MAVGAMRVALAVGAGSAVAALAVLPLLALLAALAVGMGSNARARRAAMTMAAIGALVALRRRQLQGLDRLGGSHEALRQRLAVQRQAGQPLDVAQIAALVGSAEGDR